MAPTRSRKPARTRTGSRSVARGWEVKHADCLAALPGLASESVDAVITDPPYGISVNGMNWDRPAELDPARVPGRRGRANSNPNSSFEDFSKQWSSTALRVLKPGGHLAAFAAPRTAHRLACGLEEAGFELRDVLMWIQGKGFPGSRPLDEGWGTKLKPAYEPIILARKPFSGSLAQNFSRHGTGALNIDACRVVASALCCKEEGRSHAHGAACRERDRWPTNVLLSHARSCTSADCRRGCPIELLGHRHRFFYCTKASRAEREAGTQRLPKRTLQTFKLRPEEKRRAATHPVANIHPTVKPLELMRWLVRLLTAPGGFVLDPFAGSGSTGAAAVLEGARFLGIEREEDYVPIARARIEHWSKVAHRQRQRGTREP